MRFGSETKLGLNLAFLLVPHQLLVFQYPRGISLAFIIKAASLPLFTVL
jgi:hypothetical protein